MQIRSTDHDRTGPSTLPIRIFTHNIRYAATGSELQSNEKPWPDRFPLILAQFLYHTRHIPLALLSHSRDSVTHDLPSDAATTTSTTPTTLPPTAFISLQEVLHSQLVDLLHGLNGLPPPSFPPTTSTSTPVPLHSGPHYASIGLARDDGHTQGEYNPIIYPVAIFRCLDSSTIWLSPTPHVPSRGWDAGCNRILTVGVFEHRSDPGVRIVVANTHLDNVGVESRERGVGVVVKELHRLRWKWAFKAERGLPVLLTGDFNSFDTDLPYQLMQEAGFVDARSCVEPCSRYGDGKTFTAFGKGQDVDEQGRIDFVWLGKHGMFDTDAPRVAGRCDRNSDGVIERDDEEGHDEASEEKTWRYEWNVDGYAVLPNQFGDEEVYCSDHRCVVVDISLRLN